MVSLRITRARRCKMPNDAPIRNDSTANNASGRLPWTVLEILRWTTDYFKRHDIESPRADAEVLLAHCIECERIDLYLRFDQPLNSDELSIFKQLIKRRSQHEPIAYIIGYKEFWSLPFKVSPDVLIPRPDTECLVETALQYLTDPSIGPIRDVLELGVGSGAVVVSLAHEKRDCRYWASDLSWPAMHMATVNARHNGVASNIRFFVGCWLDAIRSDAMSFDMILSNPPYIPTAEIKRLAPDIHRFEPVTALDGGADGLDKIRTILTMGHHYLKPGGCLFLEIGFDQGEAVSEIVSETDAYDQILFHRDYSGHTRVAQMRKRYA